MLLQRLLSILRQSLGRAFLSSCMSQMATASRETAPVWWEEARAVGTKVSSVDTPRPTCMQGDVTMVTSTAIHTHMWNASNVWIWTVVYMYIWA